MTSLPIERRAILRYRLAVNHLAGERLRAGDFATAARSGLQDGSPWSGLLSLHARVDGVTSETWRDPQLVQVFGPRGAVYLVPAADLAVFTLGVMPADPEHRERIQEDAAAVHAILDGQPMSQSEVLRRIPSLAGTRALRWVGTTGTVLPTWDTVDTVVRPGPAPDMSIDEAGTELALRFFRAFGPATPADLKWWLDTTMQRARDLFETIESDLVRVATEVGEAFVTKASAHLLEDAPAPRPLLLLPPDDVYINRRTAPPWFDQIAPRTLWPQAPPPGAVVVHEQAVATWRRRGRHVSIHLASPLTDSDRTCVGAAVESLPLPGSDVPRVSFIDG